MLPSTIIPIEVIKSSERLHYRNRIQLHYHFGSSSLGFKEKNSNRIHSVPHCMIMEKAVEEKYHWLLKNWKHELSQNGHAKQGHIEIYQNQNEVQIIWNKAYADQGFSQVNVGTNLLMTETIQILSNCLINALDGRLELIATNLEVTIKVLLRAQTSEPGSFCINTKNLSDILRELPNEELDLIVNANENVLKLNCKKINYSLLITETDDYPQISFESHSESIILKSNDIANIINKTSHAISTDETRVNLNGIYFQQLDSKLRAVAIDGHRLALLDLNNFNSQNTVLQDGVIIPKKGIAELKKLAEAYSNSEITIHLDESFLYASANEEYFLSVRLIAREYPKYQTVIPSKTSFSITLDRNALIDAVKRIKLLSNEKTNGVKLSIKETELIISADHPSLGHAKEIIPISYNGKEMEIGFNAKYMVDSLNILDVNEVIYEFNNELSPVIIRSDQEENFLGIIMPLKI